MIAISTDVYATLTVAIQHQIPVSLVYNGSRRLVCPHSLGANAKGQSNCLCYQIDGESRSGLEHPGSDDNWRCFRVSKISEAELSPFSRWLSGANHSCANTCVVDVDVEVT